MTTEHDCRILLLDDEWAVLSAYRRVLRQTAAELVFASCPADAIKLMEQRPADIVISDYRMSEMTGDRFLGEVRARWPQAVRILATGVADPHVLEEALRCGEISRFISKPWEPDKLRDTIDEAISLSRQQRARCAITRQLDLDLHSYKHLFMGAGDPMVIADLEGNIVEVNAAFTRAAGADIAGEQAPRARLRIEGAIGEQREWAAIRRILENEQGWSDEIEIDDRQLLITVSALTDAAGETYAYSMMQKDVTSQRRLEQSDRAAQYEVILALARLAEYRDPETGAHLERMRRYSQILAAHLSRRPEYAEVVDEAFVEAIFYASPLHDIGKVGIPDAVLLKPGKLEPEEWQIMRTHPQISGEVLRVTGATLQHSRWLRMARTIALQHHEKVDGSGYPAGLAGDEISLCARIVALADAYDAMTSKRVYKAALSHEEARGRVLDDSGSHFDPAIVAAFIACEQQFKETGDRFQDAVSDRAA